MPSGSMHHAAPLLRPSTANILTDLGWFAATLTFPAPEPGGASLPAASGDQGPRVLVDCSEAPIAVPVNVRVSEWENKSV